MAALTLAARPLMEVALSTVTGTRTGATTAGGAATAVVASGGRAAESGATTGSVEATAGFCVAASFVCGDTYEYAPSTPQATTTMATRPLATRRGLRPGASTSSRAATAGTPLRLAAFWRASSAACRSARLAARPPTAGPVAGPRTGAGARDSTGASS